jgi:predicted RNA-binding Zn-ribbon protein involved in translation (DUF1610 family)
MDKPKIIFLDIETSYNKCAVWSPGYNLTVTPESILKERGIICVCYEYMDSPKRYELRWDENQCDKQLLIELGKVLHEADLAIGHNGDAFDLKWIKTRIAHHGLPPLTNIASVDTLKLCRSNFRLNSNKLDYAAKFFGCGGKMSTGGLKLWMDIVENKCPHAMEKMVKYCHRDVRILKNFFKRILPYVDKLPVNLAILKGGTRDDCPSCGSKHVHKHGFRVKSIGKYQKYKCNNCAHVFVDGRMVKDVPK